MYLFFYQICESQKNASVREKHSVANFNSDDWGKISWFNKGSWIKLFAEVIFARFTTHLEIEKKFPWR